MKGIKTILGIALATAGFGGAVAVGASAVVNNQNNEVQMAEAGTSDYYIVGSFNSWAAPGNSEYQLQKDDGSTDLGKLLNYHIEKDTVFAFAKTGWSEPIRWAGLNSGGGTAKPYFENANDGDKNIKCLVTGDYNFFLNSSSQIYVNFANETNAYVQLKDWTNTYIYTFDETTNSSHKIEQFGGWPGKKLDSSSGGANFNSSGGIGVALIQYHTLANTKVIIHNNSGTQTSNLALVSNGYYLHNATSGNTSLGPAAKLVIDVVAKIADATTLYNNYSSLDTTAKNAVNASTLWTHKDSNIATDDSGRADISFSLIMSQLKRISESSNGSRILYPIKEKYNLAIVLSLLASFSGVSLFMVLFSIKRKKKEQ